MLVGYKWLKEFVDFDLSPEETAELLTMGGTEVEAVTHVGTGLDKVIAARVLAVEPHPDAEKLHLARIDLGDREETVVCGAPNVAAGQTVAYAPPGTTLPSGMEITARTVRGIESPGMICSEKELAISEDHSGILVLPEDTPIGKAFTEIFPTAEDYILETGVTPNRGDCLSVLGTAREVAALLGKEWRLPEFEIEEAGARIEDRMALEVPDEDLCPRYVARLVTGITIAPSPLEIRMRLFRHGMRPISNVVDATNYILLECGQPLHAFDYRLLKGRKIVVRRCDPGETFTTLDGEKRTLPPNSLMIRDGERSVALAGIMGGLNSEINENTADVLIESACFEPLGVRRTAKALGMGTEAAYRFERGVDPEGTLWAAHRAAYLIARLTGGTIAAGHLDCYPKRITRPTVKVRVPRVNTILGLELTEQNMSGCLKRLGIAVEDGESDHMHATAPSWRWDLDREEDMAEEVARIHGFQNIPVSSPRYRSAPDHSQDHHRRIRRVNALMNACGFSEIVSMSFVTRDAAEEFLKADDTGNTLSLMNPLTEDYTTMRTSLISGLLAALKRNMSFRSLDLRLYELGRVFQPVAGEELPREELRLAALGTGSRYPMLWHFQRGEVDVTGKVIQSPEFDFYDLKGALENVLEGLGVEEARFRPSGEGFLHPGKSADILLDGEKVGYIGQLSPAKITEHDLPKNVHIFEILLEPLLLRSRKESVFKPLPRYPYIERDLSVVVERKVSGEDIKHLISRLGGDIISSVILFDLYRGESIPEGFRSMAFRIRYQSGERTLTDAEVEEVHSRVVETLVNEVGAAIRE